MTGDEAHSLHSRYSAMSDGELEQLANDAEQLTDEAQSALRQEIARRGLDTQLVFRDSEVSFREMVTIRAFRDLPEAALAQGILEAAGIECSLANANIVRMDWFYSNAVGGIKLQVAAQDAEAANEILMQPIPENFEVDGVGEYWQPHCPKCNSLDTVFKELNEKIAYPSAWLGIPAPFHAKGWKCKSCGHTWDEPEEAELPAPSDNP